MKISDENDYTQPVEFSTRLGGYPINVVSKPGLPPWDQVFPAASLISEQVHLPHKAKALLLGSHQGAPAIPLALETPSCELWLADRSFIALQMSARTLQANSVNNARIYPGIDLFPDQPATFDVVIIELPKGRKVAQRWLIQSFLALRPGGQLYLAGANNLGIQPAIRDAAALFGAGAVLAYKKGNRIARFSKATHQVPPLGWWLEPGIAPGSWCEIHIDTSHKRYDLLSLPGIFSYDRLDEGTQLLLDQLQIASSDSVLDLGCGYGLIGLVAACMGAKHVDLVDADLLALAAAEANLARYQVSNAQVHASDVLSALSDLRYTLILSNPPYHTGHSVDYQVAQAFVRQSQVALEKHGHLLVVANRFIRYDRLMGELFRQVHILAETPRYHLLEAVK